MARPRIFDETKKMYNLRITNGLYQIIEGTAKRNNRSTNAEIINALEKVFRKMKVQPEEGAEESHQQPESGG